MADVLQIEYSPNLLSLRRDILAPLGYSVISILGTADALAPSLLRQSIGTIVIGHGASCHDRKILISYFRETLPDIPIIALLRKSDIGFNGADFSCPCDDPPLWIRTVTQAVEHMRCRSC